MPHVRSFGWVRLAAGLILLSALLRADPIATGRSVAPAGDEEQSVSEAARVQNAVEADFKEQDTRLRALDSRLRDQDGRIQDQSIRVSAVAASLEDNAAALASTAKAQERLSAALEGLRERIESLERKSLGLSDAQAGASVASAAEVVQQEAFSKDLLALKRDLAVNQDSLSAGLKTLNSTQVALSRLDSMDELLALVKKDVDSNDEELVEVKQTLQRLEPAPSSDNAAWWDSVISYKYLPAVATGLAIVALGVAAFHH